MTVIKQDNREEYEKFVYDNLKANNREKCKWFNEHFPLVREKVNFIIFDGERQIGGAVGFVEYNWYFLDLLWLDEKCRGNDVGTTVIKQIEDYAKSNYLTGVRMETWNFQARGFYEKLGYVVYGTIEDCPPGATNYYLKKKFD